MNRHSDRVWVAACAAAIVLGFLIDYGVTAHSSKVPPKVSATVLNGMKQAKAHSAEVSTPPLVPFIRTLSDTKKSNKACPCATVFQMQRALKAAKYRPAKSVSTGDFGNATRTEIKAFQRAKKIPPSGVYGLRTHKALSKFYDKTGRARLQQVAHARKIAAITAGLHTIGEHFLRVGGNTLAYSEGVSRGILGTYPALPPATDCAGFVEAMYRDDGLADPSGLAFSPVGWTGTLGLHGVRVSAAGTLHVGDLVFYGGGYPYGHVAMIIDPKRRLVLSHGDTGVHLLAMTYRPVSAVRRYF